MTSVVFFSQNLTDQSVVDGLLALATQLNTNHHRLVLIGLGDVDPEDKYVKQLSPYKYIWINPRDNPVFSDWSTFIWKTAYNCDGNPPPTVTPAPPEPTFTFPATTTTAAPGPSPCSGKLLVMLDTSGAPSLTDVQFRVS
jgi:hypothetical protein